jgi:hypothetical protein
MFVSHVRNSAAAVMKHWLAPVFAIALVGCGSSSGNGTPVPPDGGTDDGGGGSGTTKSLTLLLTGKVSGSLEPCG